MKSLSKSILVAIVITFNLFEPASSMESSDRVPFRLHRGYMILVEGRIENLDGLTFLVDTGASSTLLNSCLARKLKIKGSQRKAVAYGRDLKVQGTILREFTIGATRFRTVPALIADFSRLPMIGNRIDAIIGMNALIRENFSIDYKSKTLVFNPETASAASTALNAVGLSLVTELQVEGRTVRLLIDTGAKDLILFRSRLGDVRLRTPAANSKTIYHLSSAEELHMVRLSSVRLGETELSNVKAYLMEGPIQEYAGVEGILGVDSLGLDRIDFDFDRQLVSWSR